MLCCDILGLRTKHLLELNCHIRKVLLAQAIEVYPWANLLVLLRVQSQAKL